MTRRDALQRLGASTVAGLTAGWAKSDESPPRRTGLGLVIYCQSLLRKQQLRSNPGFDLFHPLDFVRHCHRLGAGGIQASIKELDNAGTRGLRSDCESFNMFFEAIISLPRNESDLDRFRREMQLAQQAGARAVRCVIIPGRRYERFDSLESFRAAEAAGRAMLERAEPIAAELQLPLAVENHKDQRNDERIALFESIDSEYVGACVDTGNSLALLEDPLQTVREFAPWAHAVHLKDQAVQRTADGFRLADIPLGEGCLPLREMVQLLRQEKPGIPMSLELITRDPLYVPCLSEEFWRPFDQVPAQDLARVLRLVSDAEVPELTQVSTLNPAEQVDLERHQVRNSLDFARDALRL